MQRLLRLGFLALLAATGVSSAIAVTGCAAMAADQQAYNTNQCNSFGLTPGSDAYIQCMSQGANAYAAARSANANNAPPPGIAVLPINIGIPVGPLPPAQNNACSAPKSTPRGACAGCSVSCSAQHASCSAGQEFPGGSDLCLQEASCTCQ